jgi:hypothetical protein
MSDDIIRKALGMTVVTPVEQGVAIIPTDSEQESNLEVDFDYVISNLKELIAQGQEAISELISIAKQSQHPRAFEVVATLLKATADMNNDIVSAHAKKHNIKPTEARHSKGVAGNVTNNLFVGSTAELQNFLEQQKSGKYE